MKKLLKEAQKVQKNAYARYSDFKVGAALRTSSGKVYSGCNVENSSYGLTMCAERNAIAGMIADGEHNIEEIVIVGDTEKPLPPCGACRQVIAEFSKPDTKIVMYNRNEEKVEMTLEEILPLTFLLKEYK